MEPVTAARHPSRSKKLKDFLNGSNAKAADPHGSAALIFLRLPAIL